ncbi:putative oxalate decarboxylase [Lyophyllum shimeji]|uniref:Oxalate decarboxylase n=1 Tax=Lyophyllum shimeji TaxID=47721 RepID=A0A9P3PV86_LYOSH|nr:putative oxalate decarboxylase [Lyophyllum shimeji]
MSLPWSTLITTFVLIRTTWCAPAPASVYQAIHGTTVHDGGSIDPNVQLWHPESHVTPQPVRGNTGAIILGPQNVVLGLQNADLVAPPSTDHGALPNLKWPMSLSHTRLGDGGWAREQNVDVLPAATALAGVNMRLKAGAVRELHWHSTAEWAYVLKGVVRISTVTPEGKVFVGDVAEGDLWYFPAGNPHSLQATNATEDGAEFLLIFDSGAFSEDATFLLTDWLTHVPKSVLAKNFGVKDLSMFDHIPEKELYIFPSSPPPEDIECDMVVPNNTPHPYTFALSKVKATKKPGGSVKVVDSRTFRAAEKISAVEVEVEVGGMRELHWHPTQPEWTFYISGEARVTVFGSSTNAQTYNFMAGDVGYIPPSFGHYVENTGNTTLKFLEIFQSGICEDIALTQWLALTPPALVKAHLGFSDEMISKLSRVKQEVVL